MKRLLLVALVLSMAACSDGASEDPSTTAMTSSASTLADESAEGATGVLEELPPGSRDTNDGGEPRSADYWIVWSTCGEDNRAAEAAANGGVDAGWYLVDDLLAYPGVSLADHEVTTCEEAIDILDASDDAVFDRLVSFLLAAELNLNSGAETCEAAEQSLRASHLALTGLDYAGPRTIRAEPGTATLQLIDLLGAYNSGELCR